MHVNPFARILEAFKYFFKEKSCEEPDGSVVQPDDASDIPAGLTVVPGTHIAFFEQTSGDEFCEKYGAGVDAPPKQRPFILNPMGDRRQKSSHSVNGEHPDGRAAFQFHLSPLKGFEACPEDFQTPASESAENKFIFHGVSMPGKVKGYPEKNLLSHVKR